MKTIDCLFNYLDRRIGHKVLTVGDTVSLNMSLKILFYYFLCVWGCDGKGQGFVVVVGGGRSHNSLNRIISWHIINETSLIDIIVTSHSKFTFDSAGFYTGAISKGFSSKWFFWGGLFFLVLLFRWNRWMKWLLKRWWWWS